MHDEIWLVVFYKYAEYTMETAIDFWKTNIRNCISNFYYMTRRQILYFFWIECWRKNEWKTRLALTLAALHRGHSKFFLIYFSHRRSLLYSFTTQDSASSPLHTDLPICCVTDTLLKRDFTLPHFFEKRQRACE